VENIPADSFANYYGVDITGFLTLVRSGRVLPLLPSSSKAFPYHGSQNLEHLSPLFVESWPSSDRSFRLSQNVTVASINADELSKKTIHVFTQLMGKAAIENV